MGRLLEGFWDCNYCGTTRIGGSQCECPNCGKVRDKDTHFYLDTTVGHYVPKERAVHINRNPDWLCNYCDQLNSDDEKICVSCGAPRTEENLNYFENRAKAHSKDSDSEDLPTSHTTSTDNFAHTAKTNSYSKSEYDFEKTNSSSWHESFESFKDFFASNLQTLLIGLLVVIGIVGLVFLFIPKEQEITIDEFTWERTIEIERYQTVEESDWYLPVDARLQYTRQEFSHYQEVFDHYETRTRQVAHQRISGYETYVSGYRDLGNGYFEEITSSRPIYETYYETETYQEAIYRSEPVYRTKYYYEIDKWLYERSVKTNGSDKSPYWGETNLASDERVSSQHETYKITGLNQKEKEQTILLSFEDWSSLEIGQTIKVKVSIVGYGEILEVIE